MTARSLLLLLAAAAAALPGRALAYAPCGARLDAISATSGHPGDRLVLHGAWGERQDKKIPVINSGSVHRLEVIEWHADAIVARVPAGLAQGHYRVGVYCNELSEGGTYSSGFMDYQVLGAAGPSQAVSGPAGALMHPDDREPGGLQRVWRSLGRLTLPALVGWAMLLGVAVAILWMLVGRRR